MLNHDNTAELYWPLEQTGGLSFFISSAGAGWGSSIIESCGGGGLECVCVLQRSYLRFTEFVYIEVVGFVNTKFRDIHEMVKSSHSMHSPISNYRWEGSVICQILSYFVK